MKQWGDMSQVVIGNGRARLPESLDDSGNLEMFHPKKAEGLIARQRGKDYPRFDLGFAKLCTTAKSSCWLYRLGQMILKAGAHCFCTIFQPSICSQSHCRDFTFLAVTKCTDATHQ